MKVLAATGDQRYVEVSCHPPIVAAPPALAIDALYAEHAPFITRVLARLTGDGPHVDDLVQETFIVAFRKQATFDAAACAPRTWLYGIAARLAMRHHRGLRRWLRALGGLAGEPVGVVSLDRQLDRDHASAVVHAALARIPFRQREVLVLYELEELEGHEIAALLAIPVNTVWTRLHHGRKRLEAALRQRPSREP